MKRRGGVSLWIMAERRLSRNVISNQNYDQIGVVLSKGTGLDDG